MPRNNYVLFAQEAPTRAKGVSRAIIPPLPAMTGNTASSQALIISKAVQ